MEISRVDYDLTIGLSVGLEIAFILMGLNLLRDHVNYGKSITAFDFIVLGILVVLWFITIASLRFVKIKKK